MPSAPVDTSLNSGIQNTSQNQPIPELEKSVGNHGSMIISASLNDSMNDSGASQPVSLGAKKKKVKKVKKKRKLD